jgi:hypothetical protein
VQEKLVEGRVHGLGELGSIIGQDLLAGHQHQPSRKALGPQRLDGRMPCRAPTQYDKCSRLLLRQKEEERGRKRKRRDRLSAGLCLANL